MWYWFALSLMFALLIGFGLFTFIWVKKHKDEEPERNELTACIISHSKPKCKVYIFCYIDMIFV